jgi:hypothetical protein
MSVAGSVAVTPVDISPVTPVDISPAVVACDVDGGGAVMPVDISPAKADRASTRVNTNTAQSRRKVFILISSKDFLVL